MCMLQLQHVKLAIAKPLCMAGLVMQEPTYDGTVSLWGVTGASKRGVGVGHLHDALGSQALLEKDAADSGIHCAERIIQQHDVSS